MPKHLIIIVIAISMLSSCSSYLQNNTPQNSHVNTSSEPEPSSSNKRLELKILGINDFHGQVLPYEDKGGMYMLSKSLLSVIDSTKEKIFIAHAGDQVGASPAESALLQDEPAIDFLNLLQYHCTKHRLDKCAVLGTAGNHEFDEGREEMLRLLHGGNHAKGPFIKERWSGATYETLSANVIDKETGETLLKPYTVHFVENIPIGFIGITIDSTPELVTPGMLENLNFLNQLERVTYYANTLQELGVESIVLIAHDGTSGHYYPGATKLNEKIPKTTKFGQFLHSLPSSIDLVISGHSHSFTNAYVESDKGKKILVTQAFSNGLAYSDINIIIDTESGDIVDTKAHIVKVDETETAQLSDDAASTLKKIESLIDSAKQYTSELTNTLLNTYKPADGEITLGQFIANSHRYSLKTDVAVINKGGIRAPLQPGDITWGELFAIQPFGNELIIRRYKGNILRTLIENGHHWSSNVNVYNGSILINEKPIDDEKTYTVGGNAYFLNSDNFKNGTLLKIAGYDIDATTQYIQSLPNPFNLNDTPE